MNDKILEWAIKIQSIAQAGLTYGHDPYDKERYEELRSVAAEMISERTEIPAAKIQSLFCNESGYQTPKVDTRAAIADKLIAVQDWRLHNVCNYAYGVVKIFVLCKVIGGSFEKNIETTEIKYFGRDELPDNLAVEKTSAEQILMCFDAYHDKNWRTQFD